MSRQLLLKKLKELSFDIILIWFINYLSNRQQLTTIGSHYNSYCNVKDYEQETSLGLILFLIYINSITALVLKNRLFIFADDKTLVNFNDNWE